MRQLQTLAMRPLRSGAMSRTSRIMIRLSRRFGSDLAELDIYFANAGMIVLTPSSRVGVEEFDAQFATNARGVFFGVQKVAPLLRNGGSIILTSSIASDKVLRAMPSMPAARRRSRHLREVGRSNSRSAASESMC